MSCQLRRNSFAAFSKLFLNHVHLRSWSLESCQLRQRGIHALSGTLNLMSSSGAEAGAASPKYSNSNTISGSGDKYNTVLTHEIENFEKIASSWWSLSGEFKALHSMNELRIPFIRDGLLNNTQVKSSDIEFPLDKMSILDVGCGGGILSLPLGRLGAHVIGLDAGSENIAMANSVLKSTSANCPRLRNKIQFICTSLEEFTNENINNDQFDGVVISEVIEHVANPKYFLQLATQLIKPNGSLFITTINRTHLSWLGAIVAGEYIFRILPTGTHNWNQFVTPEEIQSDLAQNGLNTQKIHGMAYNIWTNKWNWSRCTDINYALHAVKI